MISTSNLTTKHLLTVVSYITIALLTGIMAAEFSSKMVISMVLGIGFFIVAFVKIEFALYLLIFSMLLSPEFTVGSAGGEVSQRGGVTVRLDDFLLLVIGFSWFTKTAINKELGLFLKTPLNLPIFLYLIVCLISTALGVMGDRVDAKVGIFFVLKYFEYFIVYFMVVNHIESREQVNRFLACLFITCFLVAIYGMIQIPAGGRVSAPFEGEMGEPNTLGGYLLFVGALAIGLFPKIENSRAKHLIGILILAIAPPLLFTQSRSTYLAMIPMGLYLALRSTRPAIIIGLMVSFLIVSPFLLPKAVIERIKFTFTQVEHLEQIQVGQIRLDTSLSARLNSWQHAALAGLKHPVIGHGVTGYRFLDAQLPRVFAETGIIGVAAFFYLIYSIFKLAFNRVRQVKTPYYRGLTIGFIAGLIGLLFHAIGTNTFMIVRIMEPFWFVAAIVFALLEIEAREQYENADELAPAK